MGAFKYMALFYAAMIGVPVLLMFMAFSSVFPQLDGIRYVLMVLIGLGSLAFGIVGFKEVFMHG